jgi:hypothetical protein
MKFGPITNSVTFEFKFVGYTINIADYVSDDNIPVPEGKLTVYISKNDETLSRDCLQLLAGYINHRTKGNTTVSVNVLVLDSQEDSDFMQALLAGLILLPL